MVDHQPDESLVATRAAADLIRDRVLLHGESLISPGREVWTSANLDDLHQRFVVNMDASADPFEVKLERQLAGASDETIQLMAEIYYIHLLAANDIRYETKRRNLDNVLGWMTTPADMPAGLDDGLQRGFAGAGMGFRSGRPGQLRYLIAFSQAWLDLDAEERRRLLADPWEFKDSVYAVGETSGESQRNVLLHIVHPATFEAIVSQYVKREIVAVFSDLASDETDVDRALLGIRRALEQEVGHTISFYHSPIVERWQRVSEAPAEEFEEVEESRRAWLVRAGRAADDHLDDWLANGYAAIGWADAGEIPDGTPRAEIVRLLEEAYPDRPKGWIRSSLGNVNRFVNQVRPGDVVVTPRGQSVYVGTVTSGLYWTDRTDRGEARRRKVDWANAADPVERSQLSEGAFSKLRTLLTVSDITPHVEEFDRIISENPSAEPQPIELASVTDSFAESLHLPAGWLNDILDLLQEKRQLVFYGPPGTGKTFVAQALADHITESDASTLVQFHPSYAYEDFFEGFRPVESTEAAGVSFELVPGPLRRIAESAQENPSRPYVLIIDEINRANIAKVFGELYFLLEYRDRTISLQYGGESEFSLPRNLFIIGTMNTADRSIAFIDAAMRRRFYFVPFFPRQHPIDALLGRWLEQEGLDDRAARLLALVNDRIDDDDFAIGPSYLMSRRAAADAGLARIWDHAIVPLLEEHYFGTGRDVKAEFGLDSLLRTIDGTSGVAIPGEEPS